jgi:hypothetical protein
MKSLLKSLVIVSFGLLTTTINAQVVVNKPIVCDSTEKIAAEIVKGEYQEKPIWAGVGEEKHGAFMILANQKTGTWTILQTSGQWSCIIGTGDKFSIDSLKSILNPKNNQK